MGAPEIGALCFGLVIGWIVYRTLRRRADAAALSDIATVLGAVGGGVVLALFKNEALFGYYSIGLAIGFFLYLIVAFAVSGKKEVEVFLGD